jgi:hypothetical protein
MRLISWTLRSGNEHVHVGITYICIYQILRGCSGLQLPAEAGDRGVWSHQNCW